jgi:hypothetical protein
MRPCHPVICMMCMAAGQKVGTQGQPLKDTLEPMSPWQCSSFKVATIHALCLVVPLPELRPGRADPEGAGEVGVAAKGHKGLG